MIRDEILRRLFARLYGSPIVRNDARGELVEEIVAMALEPDWNSCGSDWGACDLIRPADGLRIQVKQSAGRQSWTKIDVAKSKPCFSIAPKTGRWEDGDRWIAEPGRNADIFIFGWHPRTNATADHRDPEQWQFYVVAERELPSQKSISLSRIEKLTQAVSFGSLAAKVRDVASNCI